LLGTFCDMFPEHVCGQHCVRLDDAEQRCAAEEMHFNDFTPPLY